MKYLLDTHTFLWFVQEPSLLSKKALETMTNTENIIYWSAASFWELTVKISLGKIKMHDEWQASLKEEKRINRILDLPITSEHCEPNLTLPWHHRDPFDRLLINQAITENFTIITKDSFIKKYKVKTLW
ncbi:type II toxin-antitoxin system VapC family toxin [Kamptonema cortianum]|uniref:Type II toxin-antitoxin system VapC family toxin n=1 Tax=Geitlerinema calcuttense NRMC-F 0142 TaxID=2922238 RepID=A0ABT7LX82_9CYAN|nr:MULTISPECIES: type II toxin-antitoxin system VapC family toxin [Cyanophyceae]MDK3156665.1 type II toxin-antitoxin system VapC family toxin [Kamptonema cortianum]MDL5050327.1 type II toxin-antitoxin system VapC family toxin [Oscillatoria amoena NRMC-F 0135]MDL5053402.1 type II toxin-antitoxin system VapC family toxin [Oscillatoria laete-virens NRMC-F 0139]MDL5056620.1 type II toxin-antitoxin system VapC family toxin [Geitlerinema calcuttense NRMC-F 0142]